MNDSSGVRTTRFWSGRSGFESLSCHTFLWFHWHLSEFPIVPMAQWVGQQGSEAAGTGSNPSIYLHSLPLLIRRKIVIPPFYAWELSRPKFFWKPGTVPNQFFRYSATKKISTENSDITFLYIKVFNNRNFLKHWIVPQRIFFGTVR